VIFFFIYYIFQRFDEQSSHNHTLSAFKKYQSLGLEVAISNTIKYQQQKSSQPYSSINTHNILLSINYLSGLKNVLAPQIQYNNESVPVRNFVEQDFEKRFP